MGDLFDAVRAKDPAALAELDRIVRRIARSVCRGGGPAGAPDLDWEDVAQEVCHRVHAVGLAQYRGAGSEQSYLYSVVKATVIQMTRSSKRRRKRELAVPPLGSAHRPDSHARLDVQQILALLDEACRDLMERLFLRDQSYADTARELGLAESSVRAKLSRCLGRARRIAGEAEKP